MELLGEIKAQDPGRRIKEFGSDGSFRFTRFVLNPDFRETKFVIVDVGGSKDVVVSSRDISGAQKEAAHRLFNGNGNLVVTQFVLNFDFTNLGVLRSEERRVGKECSFGWWW